jgi:hypothetical protein
MRLAVVIVAVLAFLGFVLGVRNHAHRSASARREFQLEHPCPSTGDRSGRCPGYIVDHVIPLACGGADRPRNMQWQTVAAAHAKDKWERKGCR